MRKYSEYKNSDIPWIGNIPSHWNIERGKNVLTLLDRPIMDTDDVITCFRDGEVTLRKNRREEGFTLSFQEIGYQGIEPGDLVVHGMDGFAGAIGVSDSRGKATPVLNVMDSIHNKRFLMYYLRTAAYKDVFMSLSTGIRVRSCDLRWNKLSVFPFVLPEREEQDRIAEYIDDKLLQINNIISEAKASIEEYKAWKASIIYETITKGLRSINSPIKTNNSKFPYIPQKWCVIRFKYLLSIKSGDSIQNEELIDNGDYPVYGGGECIGYANQYNCDDRNILIGRVGARCGFTTLLQSRAWATDNALIVNSNIYVKYLYYMLVAANLNTLNTSNAQPLITGTKIKNCMMPYTNDKSEQIEMVSFLDSRCANIDEIIDEKNKLIKDLEAYKKSLIFEVVTGKRKVV